MRILGEAGVPCSAVMDTRDLFRDPQLLARGFVRTSGHSERLHQELVQRGLAKLFDGKLAPIPSDHLTDLQRVADRLRALMGIPGDSPSESI